MRWWVPKTVLGVVLAILTVPLTVPAHAYPRPGVVERVSVSSAGVQGNDDSGYPTLSEKTLGISMTPDGRFVAFTSRASNLVPGDINGINDVFVRDLRTGTTRIASVPTVGSAVKQGVGPLCTGSANPAISTNGRYVAFDSCDINLVGVGNDRNLADDVFVHDMKTGRTTMVSVASDGSQSNLSANSELPSISANGRYVAFMSAATNFGPTCPSGVAGSVCASPAGPTLAPILGGTTQIFVHDMKTRKTTLVSVTNGGGTVANGASFNPSISPDGRDVVFTTYADNLSSSDSNISLTNPSALPSAPDVYVRDLETRKTTLVSVGVTGRAASGGAFPESGNRFAVPEVADGPAMSADDRYVVFGSSATDLVPNGAGGGIFVRDLKAGRTERVSVSSAGEAQSAGGCGVGDNVTVSRDGRYAAFACDPDPTCADADPYVAVYDRLAGSLDRVSLADGQPDCSSNYSSAHPVDDMWPQLSAHGDYVAFASGRSGLVKGDTNGHNDVFVAHRGSDLGVGAINSGGASRVARLTLADRPDFGSTGVAARTDSAQDANTALTVAGANLIGASMAYRPGRGDVFVRLSLARMPMFVLASPTIVYGLDLTMAGTAYQVRAAKTGPDNASFGLFRQDGRGRWIHTADLAGGYGTTGQEVVFALPLSDVGAGGGGRLDAVRGYTALGSYADGPTTTVDKVQLAP